jgi:hypothetical protein
MKCWFLKLAIHIMAAGLEGVVLKRNLRQHLGCKNMLGLAL